MNKRIYELKQQAGIDFNPDQEGLDLFAELIVRECLDTIGENFVGAVGTHASAHNSAVLKCQKIIKQHFGIED